MKRMFRCDGFSGHSGEQMQIKYEASDGADECELITNMGREFKRKRRYVSRE
jgi:hypothetical protein